MCACLLEDADKFHYLLQDFENKIVNVAKTGKRAELMYLQKVFESEILLAILKSLNETVADLDNIAENLVVQNENLEKTIKSRRKRDLSLLTNLLGSSSASKMGGHSHPPDNVSDEESNEIKVCVYVYFIFLRERERE